MNVYHILLSPDIFDLTGAAILTVPAPDVFTAAMRAGYLAAGNGRGILGDSSELRVISIMDDDEHDYTDSRLFGNIGTSERQGIKRDISERKD